MGDTLVLSSIEIPSSVGAEVARDVFRKKVRTGCIGTISETYLPVLFEFARYLEIAPNLTISEVALSGMQAGYSDDNRQFNYFLRFLDQYRVTPHLTLDISNGITFFHIDSDGKAIPRADITASIGNEKLVSGKTLPMGHPASTLRCIQANATPIKYKHLFPR